MSQKPILVTVVPHGWRFLRLVWIALAIGVLGPIVGAVILGVLAWCVSVLGSLV